MLIGVSWATTKMAARATITLDPPTTNGTPAATSEPKTSKSASAASGNEITSLRCKSRSLTCWTSP